MRAVATALCFLLSSLLAGCGREHLVRERYPAWGEAVQLQRAGESAPLHMLVLMPPSPAGARACLLIVHGMNEYVGRYGGVAAHFAQRFIVAGVDLHGHGLSNPTFLEADQAIAEGADSYDAGDAYLEQAHLRDLEALRKDFDQALRYLVERCDAETKRREPTPIFILSHSLGSLVVASYLLRPHQGGDPRSRIAGIILSGPAFSVTRVPGWRGWIQNPLINFSFHTHEHFLNPHDEPLPLLMANQAIALVTVPVQDGVIEVLSFPGLRRLFSATSPRWVADYVSDSEEEKARYRTDPYLIRRNVLRYVLAVEKEIIEFRRTMAEFDVPYLLIYSAHDPITPAWGSEDFAALTRNKHPDNQIIALADQSHHEHFFSSRPLREQLLRSVDQWLDRRLQADGSPARR